MSKKVSAASKRARHFPKDNRWFCHFDEHDLEGDFAFEEGVTRRDPSAVLAIDGDYHCWYTKSVGETVGFGSGDPAAKVFPWDLSAVWHATSADGWTWREEGLAVGLGPAGAYDDRSVFTPEIFAYDGRYYLVYQCVKAPYVVRVKNTIGMAVADTPFGPWRKLPEPILWPADNGEWLGEADDRFSVISKGDFDSHKVHDPCLLHYRDRFYLYYKGEQMGEGVTFGGRDVRWGVAIADDPAGPYVKSPYNPITNSGHEVCVWPYQGGVAALLTTDGPEKNTIQYAADGVNFEIVAVLRGAPEALGVFRVEDSDSDPLAGVAWGLCHRLHPGGSWQTIRRFEMRRPNYA